MTLVSHELPLARVYIDDVLMWGATKMKQEEALRNALEAARRSCIILNVEKYQFGRIEVTFLGDRISRAGIKSYHSLV